MKKAASFICMALVALLAGSCAHATLYEGRAETHTLFARIWVQDDPLVPKRTVLKGCRFWEPKGLICALVSKPEHANIRVYADHVACGEGDSKIEEEKKPEKSTGLEKSQIYAMPDEEQKTKRALAKAWHESAKIKVFTSCTAPEGEVDEDDLAIILAHEVGHLIGIWDHIPKTCDDPDEVPKTHPDGRKLCGPDAIMNPSHVKDVESITELDAMAFDLRDVKLSVVEPLDTPPSPTPRKSLELANPPSAYSGQP